MDKVLPRQGAESMLAYISDGIRDTVHKLAPG